MLNKRNERSASFGEVSRLSTCALVPLFHPYCRSALSASMQVKTTAHIVKSYEQRLESLHVLSATGCNERDRCRRVGFTVKTANLKD